MARRLRHQTTMSLQCDLCGAWSPEVVMAIHYCASIPLSKLERLAFEQAECETGFGETTLRNGSKARCCPECYAWLQSKQPTEPDAEAPF